MIGLNPSFIAGHSSIYTQDRAVLGRVGVIAPEQPEDRGLRVKDDEPGMFKASERDDCELPAAAEDFDFGLRKFTRAGKVA